MAIYDLTRCEIRHYVAALCDDLITGTVASPASGTFVCAETDWVKQDDYFNKAIEVYCYYGTGVGTSGNPTDWDGTTGGTYTLTFLPAATLTAGDKVEVHFRFNVDTYNKFINLAIEMVAKEALVNKVDTSLDMAEDTYQYDLPTDFVWVSSVEMESSTEDLYNEYSPIDTKYWRIIKGSTTKLELISEYYKPTAGREMRITGFASPSILDTDTEECPINPTWVTYQAAALLHQSRIRSSGVDSEWHSEQMKLCQALANDIRPSLSVSVGGAKSVIEA